jgi:hypothetical protein
MKLALGDRPHGFVAPRALHVVVDAEEPREHTRHVPVDEGRGLPEGDARDRARRVRTDAGHGEPLVPEAGEHGEPRHVARAGVEEPRTPVVAEPAPGREHGALVGLGERVHRGKALEEARVVRDDRVDPRLLEHDLTDPNSVRISSTSPGEAALLPRVPGEEGGAEVRFALRGIRRVRSFGASSRGGPAWGVFSRRFGHGVA